MNRKRIAMYRKMAAAFNDSAAIEKGSGAPVGTPSRAGLMYLDTLTGTMYLSRNALFFNADTIINLPSTVTADKINMWMLQNDPAPAVMRPFLVSTGYTQRVIRAVTTGNIDSTAALTSMLINGVSVPDNSTDLPLNTWSTLELNYNSPFFPTNHIGRRPTLQGYIGPIANVEFRLSGSLLASYAIDEGSGTTILDGSGNGLDATLDIGSGSWSLSWVPL